MKNAVLDELNEATEGNWRDFRSLSVSAAEKILGSTAWKILRILQKGARYSKDLRLALLDYYQVDVSEQSIYYHLRRLEDRELVEKQPESYEMADDQRTVHVNKYQLTADTFVINLLGHDDILKRFEEIKFSHKSMAPLDLPVFLRQFAKSGKFNGWIVPGSPLRHGPNDTVATDGHFAAPFAMLVGKHLDFPSHIIVKWDTEILKEQKQGENLVLLGGPFVNMLIHEINQDYLPVHYLLNKDSGLIVRHSNQEEQDELLGAIQLIPNPYNPEKTLLIIGGPKKRGTESAVVAITRFTEKVIQELIRTKTYCVVRGKTNLFDEIQDIEILSL